MEMSRKGGVAIHRDGSTKRRQILIHLGLRPTIRIPKVARGYLNA